MLYCVNVFILRLDSLADILYKYYVSAHFGLLTGGDVCVCVHEIINVRATHRQQKTPLIAPRPTSMLRTKGSILQSIERNLEFPRKVNLLNIHSQQTIHTNAALSYRK